MGLALLAIPAPWVRVRSARLMGKVELYARALRLHTQLHKLAYAGIVGLFLGWLDQEDRARIDEDYYDSVRELVDGEPRRYADEAMVRSGLSEWERSAVLTHFTPGCSVIVVGAGAGREVLALLEEGFDARGYDPHPGMVQEGAALMEAQGHPGRLLLSPRDVLPPVEETVGAVVVGWGAYSLIAGRGRRIALLKQAAASLTPGGSVLLSFIVRPPDARRLQLAHRIGLLVSRIRGTEARELGDWLMPTFFHYFTRAEIESELRGAGLALVTFSEEPYGHAIGVTERTGGV